MGIHIDPHLSKLRHGLPGFHHESEAHETTFLAHPQKSLQPYPSPQKQMRFVVWGDYCSRKLAPDHFEGLSLNCQSWLSRAHLSR